MQNAWSAITFRPFGRCNSPLKLLSPNADCPILVIPSFKVRVPLKPHPVNVSFGMDETPCGISNDPVRLLHKKKALSPNFLSLEGSFNSP